MKITILFALTLTAGNALAQQPAPRAATPVAQVDSRFAAWIGCWRLEDDLAGTGARMCITPEKNGIRLQTVVGTNKGIDEVIIPDGAEHPINDAECKGHERAEFSDDQLRVFRTTKVTCGNEAPRTVNSVAFLAGPSFINVQQVSGANTNTAVRVERYRRAANQQLADGSKAPQPTAAAISAAASIDGRWSIEDVIEASKKLPAEAVQASLAELKFGFDLNRKNLIALDGAGVHDEVIDLMVALTYPKRFVVQRRGGGSLPTGIMTGTGWFDPLMAPILMGNLADCYSPYGYGYRSYYSMCRGMMYSPFEYGWNYYGGYHPLYSSGYYGSGYYGSWIDVTGVPTGTGVIAAQSDGRVIAGRGFTQIRSRDAEPVPRSNAGGNGGGWSAAGGGTSSGNGFSSGSSSGGSSGGGASSGGDSGARVAVPKGGGQ